MPAAVFFLLLLFLGGAAGGPTAFSAVSAAGRASPTAFSAVSPRRTGAPPNPFSAKAAFARYWSMKIPNGQPKPAFLLSKASPLSAFDTALYQRLAAQPPSLAARLPSFCSAATLFCFPSLSSSSSSSSSSFSSYSSKSFSNYGAAAPFGASSFKNYSLGENVPIDSFRSYSRRAAAHSESFSAYSSAGNVVTANFTSYGGSSAAGASNFSSYAASANVPALKFSNYAASSAARAQSFSAYSPDSNSGSQSFSGYGKRASSSSSVFSSYANSSNVVASSFRNYGESAASSNSSFSAYGFDANVPDNSFSAYSGRSGLDKFSRYRDQSNVGDDKFSSYAKSSSFSGYGQSFNLGSEIFSSYSKSPSAFSTYGDNSTFKGYGDKKAASFKAYHVSSDRKTKKSKWVEEGRFFRESKLKKGTIMAMPDLRDKSPRRAFLPRAIAKLLPFSTARLPDLFRAFNATPGSALARAMEATVAECERPPSRGETKRCATSGEDVIDFATSVLGPDLVVRATASPAGSGRLVTVGKVRAVGAGRETKAVSCHQSLFPYQVYYCHAVPRVRVYAAEILGGAARINDGVAICHLDTSDWSPRHGAFVALGDGPGRIEVCHWIYPGDMTWTVAG
ncbi:polygalacturonase 1 beta-like protein 2 [Wolffia australiana]